MDNKQITEVTVILPKILRKCFLGKGVNDEGVIREFMESIINKMLHNYQKFEYEVAHSNRCAGLEIDADGKSDYKFRGHIGWSDHYKNFYLTTDGITYTNAAHALNVQVIDWIEEELDRILEKHERKANL